MGRDLEPGKLEDVLAALKDWWGLQDLFCLDEF